MAGLLEGVLPALYSGADQVKRRVKGLLSDPREFLGQRSQDLQTMQDQDSALAYGRGLLSPKDPAHARMARNEPAFNARQAAEAEQRLLDIAMQGLTVWHGSPHKFDKFDMSKIGTGEGAQSYGHGLYFAEKPEVAIDYAEKLGKAKNASTDLTSAMQKVELNGKPLLGQFDVDHMGEIVDLARSGNTRGLEDLARDRRARWESLVSDESYPFRDYAAKKLKAYNGLIGEIQRGAKVEFPGGNLYKVDLPDSAIEKMLDWDKPLSQQDQAAIKPLVDRLKALPVHHADTFGKPGHLFKSERAGLDSGSLRGADLYNIYRREFGGENVSGAGASELLRQQGIPGIRYLDGGSRGAGQGTRNFVVFDDQLPKILEVNGGLLGR